MVTISRLVRFAVSPPNPPGTSSSAGPAESQPIANDSNGFAGVPAMQGLGRFYELEIICQGEPDPATGYFLDIKVIDRAARLSIIPAITGACYQTPHAQPQDVLATAIAALNIQLRGTLQSVRWMLSPFYSVELPMSPSNTPASSPATRSSPVAASPSPVALLRQRFEIAAAHRLHALTLSDEQNRAYFGKCNNPSGHGHNYVIEPCVAVPVGPAAAANVFTVSQLEQLVERAIIQPYDHTHLNIDTAAFDQGKPGGVNPSVENIARVFFEALAPLVLASGATLQSIRVWETEKTSASYPI